MAADTERIDLHPAGENSLELLIPMVAAAHRLENIERTDGERREAVLPLLGDSSLGRIWVIGVDGHTAGYAALCFGYSIEFGGRDAFVDELYLTDAFRGRGIGAIVLERLVEAAAALGIRALHLEVNRGNERAVRLYRRWGFTERSASMLMSRPIPRN